MDIKMTNKQNRIIIKTFKAMIFSVFAGIVLLLYTGVAIKAAIWLTNDVSNAVYAFILPLLIISCYFWAKDTVEAEINKEEDLIRTLSRK